MLYIKSPLSYISNGMGIEGYRMMMRVLIAYKVFFFNDQILSILCLSIKNIIELMSGMEKNMSLKE